MGFLSRLFGREQQSEQERIPDSRATSSGWEQLPDHEKCQHARDLERKGQDDEAEEIYWYLIENGFEGSFPFRRLPIIYRRRGDYEAEVRVLDEGIALYKRLARTSPRPDINPKLEKFRKRRERARALLEAQEGE